MYSIISLSSILLSSGILVGLIRLDRTSERIFVFYVITFLNIAAIGYILSALNQLDNLRWWTCASVLAFCGTLVIAFFNKSALKNSILRMHNKLCFSNLRETSVFIKALYLKLIFLQRFEIVVLTAAFVVILFMGLLVILFTAPHNVDSMTYHLARMAYFIQNKNFDFYDANYWAQVVHPKNSVVLQLFVFLISDHNENLTQIVQFISYIVSIVTVYAITTKIWGDRFGFFIGLFAGLVSALLTSWLMQSVTTQNDMIITALTGVAAYFLLAFGEGHKIKFWFLAALSLGLAVGVKASALLVFPSLGLIALYSHFRHHLKFSVALNIYAGAVFIFIAVLMPAGYVENYRHFGHAVGPQNVIETHSFASSDLAEGFRNGSLNLVRYSIEFISLDGFPVVRITGSLQSAIRGFMQDILKFKLIGIDLEVPEFTRVPFDFNRIPVANEDGSYWGILGILLIWPCVFYVIIKSFFTPKLPKALFVLAAAALLFLVAQAYAGPYDPWRGRYFNIAAIFAVPAVSILFISRKPGVHLIISMIIVAGAISGITAILFRVNSPLVTVNYKLFQTKSIFFLDRIEQLTRSRPDFTKVLRKYDEIVPEDARVAVFLRQNSYEYPLFGRNLTRKIVPINGFVGGFDRNLLLNQVDFLLYEGAHFPCRNDGDVSLGAGWFLRTVSEEQNICLER